MKAGWRDAPLALRDSVVSNMQSRYFFLTLFIFNKIGFNVFYVIMKDWSLTTYLLDT